MGQNILLCISWPCLHAYDTINVFIRGNKHKRMKCRRRWWCIFYQLKTISINSVIIIATNSVGIPIVFPFFKWNRDHIFIISCGNHLKVHKSKIVVVVVCSVQNPSESIIMDGIVRIEFVKNIPINRKNVILNSFLANIKQCIWIFNVFYLVI